MDHGGFLMLTKIKAWFFGLFKSAEHDLALAATKAHFDEVIVDMREHFNRSLQAVAADLSADLKKYIGGEIAQRYDSLVADAGKAARLMEHSKIAMAICDECHLPNRRFALSRIDGRTICATCAAKGIN